MDLHSLFSRSLAIAALSAFTFTAATAAPVKFTFTDTINLYGAALSGVSSGDALVVEVVADNGSASLLSGTWVNEDILSAVGRVGSYEVVFGAPFYSNTPAFSTDAMGALMSNWYDIYDNNTDNAGGAVTPGFFGGVLTTSAGINLYYSGGRCDVHSDCGGRWTYAAVEPGELPEPVTLALVGLSLLGTAVTRRR